MLNTNIEKIKIKASCGIYFSFLKDNTNKNNTRNKEKVITGILLPEKIIAKKHINGSKTEIKIFISLFLIKKGIEKNPKTKNL